MIKDGRAESVYPGNWSFDCAGKALFSYLCNRLIYLGPDHLAFRFVTDAGAADAGLNEILDHLRRKAAKTRPVAVPSKDMMLPTRMLT
jgi:hypothetical protein